MIFYELTTIDGLSSLKIPVKGIATALTWGTSQGLLVLAAVSKGLLIPMTSENVLNGIDCLLNHGCRVSTTIGFSEGSWIVILLILVMAFASGLFLSDFKATAGALVLSQTLSFLIILEGLFGRPSNISALSEDLQGFFLLAFFGISLFGVMVTLIGAFIGDIASSEPVPRWPLEGLSVNLRGEALGEALVRCRRCGTRYPRSTWKCLTCGADL